MIFKHLFLNFSDEKTKYSESLIALNDKKIELDVPVKDIISVVNLRTFEFARSCDF